MHKTKMGASKIVFIFINNGFNLMDLLVLWD